MANQPTMLARMIRAAALDVDTYERIEHDPEVTGQAAAIVVLAAVALALAAGRTGPLAAVAAAVVPLAGWLLWTAITYLIGDKLLGGEATWGEVLRTVGFAHSPGVLYLGAAVPGIGATARLAVTVWILVAGFVGLRQALDLSLGKTFLTVVMGWLFLAIPLIALSSGLR